MIDVQIFDWPRQAAFRSGMFYAGGQIRPGGMTTGGVLISHKEPGGLSYFETTLGNMGECAGAVGSWLASAVLTSVFRIPIYRSPQLVSAKALGLTIPAAYETEGVPWDSDMPFDSDMGWEFSPSIPAASASLKGSETLVVDMTGYPPALLHGHVVGHSDRAYKIMDISYEGSIATCQVAPPLRRPVELGDIIALRPKMLATVESPDGARGSFRHHRHLVMGQSIRFLEFRG